MFALLVAPPAAAQSITVRPLAGLALSITFGVVVVWLGLGVAYFSIYPVGFYTTTFAFGLFVLVRLVDLGAAEAAGLMFAHELSATPTWPAPSSRSRAARSGGSSCCGARCSPATRYSHVLRRKARPRRHLIIPIFPPL